MRQIHFCQRKVPSNALQANAQHRIGDRPHLSDHLYRSRHSQLTRDHSFCSQRLAYVRPQPVSGRASCEGSRANVQCLFLESGSPRQWPSIRWRGRHTQLSITAESSRCRLVLFLNKMQSRFGRYCSIATVSICPYCVSEFLI